MLNKVGNTCNQIIFFHESKSQQYQLNENFVNMSLAATTPTKKKRHIDQALGKIYQQIRKRFNYSHFSHLPVISVESAQL